MKKEEIEKMLGYVAELGAFLTRLKHVESETESDVISEAVEKYLDGFNNTPPMRNSEVLKLNKNEIGFSSNFTKKEMKEMPNLKDLSYRYRNGIHEFRYRRNGIEKSFSGIVFNVAKKKALDFCRELNKNEKLQFSVGEKIDFEPFAENYMINVKKVNVTAKSFDVYYNRFKNYILPAFRDYQIQNIKAPHIQSFLNGIIENGYQRTAEDCFYLLKTIFQYAVDNEFLLRNPINAVKIPMHNRTIGKALTLDIERQFLKDITGNKYELSFIILLYTGCRPCELESIAFETPGFLTFRNRKQKNGKIAFKEIPITPMLEPYVERIKKALPLPATTELAKIFSKFIKGNYRMYDLRHTFSTRCQECGVPQTVVARWLGHSTGRITDEVYTHYSPTFMLEMAKKVDY